MVPHSYKVEYKWLVRAGVLHGLALLVSPHFLVLHQTRPSLLPPWLPLSHAVATLDYPTFLEDARLSSSSLVLHVSLRLGSVLYIHDQANPYSSF